MPEGPVIRLLCEKAQIFVGQKVKKASVSAPKPDFTHLEGLTVKEISVYGKQLLISFPELTVRVHLMLFGYFRINEKKENGKLSLGLEFGKGELNFYASDVRLIEEPLDDVYDWSADVMNAAWSPEAAVEKLKSLNKILACDALLDQDIFAGVGNKIKDEVLFITKVHPESLVQNIPLRKKKEMADEAAAFSFRYFDWKRTDSEEEHFLAHYKKDCPRDKVPLKKEKVGSNRRTTYYCEVCQKKY
jgi:endonuclease VIII